MTFGNLVACASLSDYENFLLVLNHMSWIIVHTLERHKIMSHHRFPSEKIRF